MAEMEEPQDLVCQCGKPVAKFDRTGVRLSTAATPSGKPSSAMPPPQGISRCSSSPGSSDHRPEAAPVARS